MRPTGDAVAEQRGFLTDALQRHAQRSCKRRPGARWVVRLDDVAEGVANPLGHDDEEDQAEDDERVAGEGQTGRPR